MPINLKSLAKQHKTAILFLHGGPGMDGSYFFPYIKPLAKEFNLLTYTQGSSGALDIEDLVGEVLQVVRGLAGKNLFILGHSFGSCLLFEYMKREKVLPHFLQGIILCAWYYDRAFLKSFIRKVAGYVEKNRIIMDEGLYKTNEEYRRNSVDLVGLYFTDEFVEEGKKIFSQGEYNVELYRQLQRTYLKDVDHREALAKITLPILSIAGKKDNIFALDYVRNGLLLNKNFWSVELATGHFPFVEKPCEFNAVLRDFVNKSLLLI